MPRTKPTTAEKEAEVTYVQNNSPYSLPDDTASAKVPTAVVKQKFYQALFYLLDLIQEERDAGIDVEIANDTRSTAIETNVSTLQGYFSNGIANKATADKNGNDIVETYQTVTNVNMIKNALEALINNLDTAITSGTKTAKKAEQDQSGNNIKASYGANIESSITRYASSQTMQLVLNNKNGTAISTHDQTIQGATTDYAGLLSASDKAKIDAIASDIASALSTAETYTDTKVARSNLVSVLGEASSSLNGLMSATDKGRLDTIFASFNDDDSDTLVNKLKEVLAVFNQYPEGTTLVNALALKVNTSDVIDNLTTEDSTKPLSAKQGKVLNTAINTKANSSDVYTKTLVYNKTETDTLLADKQTYEQVVEEISDQLSAVSNMNVIADVDNDETYTWQIKIQNGKAHFIATKVE